MPIVNAALLQIEVDADLDDWQAEGPLGIFIEEVYKTLLWEFKRQWLLRLSWIQYQ